MMRKKKRKSKNFFAEALSYIRESQRQIYIVIVLFLVSGILGFLLSPELGFLNPYLERLSDEIDGLDTFGLIWYIFSNNVSVSFFGMLFGLFLGIFPVVSSLINGGIVGYVYALASAKAGYGIIWLLVPHGIFELPAVFISLGLGLKLGAVFFVSVRDRWGEFKRRFYSSLKVFIAIIVPLLVIAAIIEGILISLG